MMLNEFDGTDERKSCYRIGLKNRLNSDKLLEFKSARLLKDKGTERVESQLERLERMDVQKQE